jgi:hypothetical protein
VLPGEVARAVLEIRRQNFVARLKVEGSRCDVHAGGRVLEEDEIVRRSTDESGELGARRLEDLGQALHEPHRLILELALPFLVSLEDDARAGAERAVVQVDDVRVEKEELSERGYGIETFAV